MFPKGGLQWIRACVCWGNQVRPRNHGSSQLGPVLSAGETKSSWLQGLQIHKSGIILRQCITVSFIIWLFYVLCWISVVVFISCSLMRTITSWMCSSAGMVWSSQWPALLLAWALSLRWPSFPSCSSRPLRRPPQLWLIWTSISWRWWCIDTVALLGQPIQNCWAATTDTCRYRSTTVHILYCAFNSHVF